MVAVMIRRENPWWVVAICCAAGLIVALALLEGDAQGIVAIVSTVVLLFAVAQVLGKDSRAKERDIDSHDRFGGRSPGG